MKKFALLCLLAAQFGLVQTISAQEPSPARTAIIHTDKGSISVKLYSLTPLHSSNFLKLCDEGFYDSTLFHRVIKNFMIQGGDPDSRTAVPGQALGNGDVGYTLPAEFNDVLFHKKGALCAARDDNPMKSSSGCQFYIVQGKIQTDSALNAHEARINAQRRKEAFNEYINKKGNELQKLRMQQMTAGNADSLEQYRKLIESNLVVPEFKYTEEQRRIYKTLGGTPHLDQAYTVFGEVMQGMDVVEKIADVPKGKDDRPLQDIRMKIRKTEENAK